MIGIVPLFAEQFAGIGLLLLLMLAVSRGRRAVNAVAGAAVGFALTTTLLLLSQSSDRFVGPNRATVANVFNHVDYIWTHLRLATPFGRFYWSTGGFGVDWAIVGGVAAAAVVLVWSLVGLRDPMPRVLTRRQIGIYGLGAIAAWMLAVAPIISSGYPWFTARVMYAPALAQGFVLAVAAEAVVSVGGRRRAVVAFTWVVLSGFAVWSGVALGAEAAAVKTQLDANLSRTRGLARLISRSDLAQGRQLVVAGYPPTDVSRPLFGEHIIGLAPPDIPGLLGFGSDARNHRPDGLVFLQSGWGGLCATSHGLLVGYGLRGTQPPRNRATKYVVWANGRWWVQTTKPLGSALNVFQFVPRCESTPSA